MRGSHSSTNSGDVRDSDFMFDLDGFEDGRSAYQPNQPISDVDESDSEGKRTIFQKKDDVLSSFLLVSDPSYKRGTGAVQISRQYGRQASLNIAKSLPISIPDVMSQFRGSEDDDLDEEQEDNVDIAASMQKLAKSVHGDAVFGDLPTRPRFSTQI
jgi:Proline-rich AKT1 substrate 1